MHVTSTHWKVGWICQHLAVVLSSQEHCILWKSNVIADSYTYVAILGLEDRILRIAWLDVFTLFKDNASWDVDIKEMELAVLGRKVTFAVEAQACIINSITAFDLFRNTSTNDILTSFLGKILQHCIWCSLIVLRCKLFVFEHVMLRKWGAEHLWEHYNICTVLGSFSYHSISFDEIISFICLRLELAETNFHGSGVKYRGRKSHSFNSSFRCTS